MKITNKMLIEYGMEKTADQSCPWIKTITSDHIEDPDSGKMSIVLDNSYNDWHFALSMPDGSMLRLKHIESMDELRAFENMIISYEPNY